MDKTAQFPKAPNPATDSTADFVGEPEQKYFAPPAPLVRVEVGAASHVGKVRSANEDRFAVVRRTRRHDVLLSNVPLESTASAEEHAYLMMVADGIGGSDFGELASSVALATVLDLSTRLSATVMRMAGETREEIKERTAAYADEIRAALRKYADELPETAGMGTTLTAAYSMGDDVVCSHIGDSRAYWVHNGRLIQVTHDHTLAQEMIDHGVPREDTVRFANVLTHWLGAKEDDTSPDVYQLKLFDGDALLLCTDGLSNMVPPEEILQVLAAHARPQAACEALVEAALAAGGKDNVTVVLARYEVSAKK
jgi:protein phosphatase